MCQVLDKNAEVWMVALDVTKGVGRVWDNGLLHMLKGYGISGEISELIKSS